MTPDEFQAAAQRAVDDLAGEGLLPPGLTAGVFGVGGRLYTVHLLGSRPYSVAVTWEEGQSFTDAVRAALAERR